MLDDFAASPLFIATIAATFTAYQRRHMIMISFFAYAAADFHADYAFDITPMPPRYMLPLLPP